MSSTGGKACNGKLGPLTLSMDQMLRPETPLDHLISDTTKDPYSVLLEKERDKLLGTGPASIFYAPVSGCEPQAPSTLDLSPHQMLGATPTETNYIPDTLIAPEKMAAFNKEMSELHPFGAPPMGWMPKDQVISIIRQIDRVYRTKPNGVKNDHV